MEAFGKHPDTTVHAQHPHQAEPPMSAIGASAVTSIEAFYVRNHGSVPTLDPQAWSLSVDGVVDEPLTMTLDELREGRFPIHELVVTLQCAGNRRRFMSRGRAIPGEAPWGGGATGTARWRGVSLADVLTATGVRDSATCVVLTGHDRSDEADPPQRFAGSIPITKARSPEVLLAWEMNGEPLPIVHGAPVRAVVPGYIGARSIKWLDRVTARASPFEGYFEHTTYRLLAADEEEGPGVGVALGEAALNCDVFAPDDGADVMAGEVEVRGYAFAGEREVVRVDVSIDGGVTWRQARLLEDLGRWAARHWSTEVPLTPGRHEIVVKAWDSAGASQPEHASAIWNPKGYVNNSWARIHVTAQ